MADIVEDFEDSNYAFPINFGASGKTWFRSTTESQSGNYSLQAPNTSGINNQDFTCTITIPPGATSVRLWGMTDCETADNLMVFVGSSSSSSFTRSGFTPWAQSPAIDVTGQTQLRIVYRKDVSQDAGRNLVWVDNIVFTIPTKVNGWGPVPLF
ncbi:hypothetical protein Ssi03_12910 [Sphaerisporangium siamense]|uniref:Uncharacterized protein n=1 Tax=Sphaerisporangium siamense TaxID=795645 RepID=A0A7W7GBL0_9ACTN|nr:hypothetical protein [Sphaerisporangium siamense]MBB4702940.1 hypothetical protein [Sphaerisporangium siamense]GII83301.1 hypothetical protein Ssi03_12910 [Sphaerisporangium siamense]